jgi:glycosyltransferase involved in cell wall biosynthesis
VKANAAPVLAIPLSICVVVPTRDRPEHIRECVGSILACPSVRSLIVIDQSKSQESAVALQAFHADARLRYVRSATRGVSAARNAAIAMCAESIIAFTDDDCRVPRDWVQRIQRVFADDPDAAVVCGRVRGPAEAKNLGYVTEFEPSRRVHRGQIPRPGTDWGISANMAVRLDVLHTVGAFDPMLGAGAPLRSGAEFDLLVRVWMAGLKVINAVEVEVLHLGVRPHGPVARRLLLGYAFGMGAAFAKHARLGDRVGLHLYFQWLAHLLGRNVRLIVARRRPTGVGMTLAYLHGSMRSLGYRIDRRTKMYAARGSDPDV